LQPTSPFRNYNHVDNALRLFIKNKAKVLISVAENNKSIYKSVLIKKNKIFPIFKKNYIYLNNQSFDKTYHPNGAIYIFRYKDFFKKKSIPIENALPYIMSRKDSLDIDDFFDYKIAKLMSKSK
jgi:CMP-N-acetylneuraminic acid synthetase